MGTPERKWLANRFHPIPPNARYKALWLDQVRIANYWTRNTAWLISRVLALTSF
jgi:hypothetical protein